MMITLLLAAAAASAAPQPGEIKTYGDWTVGCDNGWRCQAGSLFPEPQEDDLYAAGAIIFLGLPDYYRQSPDEVPSLYASILRRRTTLWFFVAVILQNYFLVNPDRSIGDHCVPDSCS